MMTREEAAHILEYSRIVSENFTQEAVTATYVMALAALRGPTREQAEKVWRGEWVDTRESSKGVPTCMCSRCTRVVVGLESKFCPDCGSPMTDKAVDTIMKRMQEMRND